MDVSRFTYKYKLYPLADQPEVYTWVQTYFTDAPFLPFPHGFTNPTFDVDQEEDVKPCISHDWNFHKITKPPASWAELNHCDSWIGTEEQWQGACFSDQEGVELGENGFPVLCGCFPTSGEDVIEPLPRLGTQLRGSVKSLLKSCILAFPFQKPVYLYPEPIAMLRSLLPAKKPVLLGSVKYIFEEPDSDPVFCGGDEMFYGTFTMTVTNWDSHPELNGTYVMLPLGWSGGNFTWTHSEAANPSNPPGGNMFFYITYVGGTGCYMISYGGSIGPDPSTAGGVTATSPLTIEWHDQPVVSGDDLIDLVAVAS